VAATLLSRTPAAVSLPEPPVYLVRADDSEVRLNLEERPPLESGSILRS
jgi:hypothetical protein